MTKHCALGVAVCLVASTAYAADGVLIVEKSTGNGSTTTNQIQIQGNRMRAEGANQTGGKHVFMFDGARQVMTLIDVDKKTYSEITKADMDRLAAQMSDAMAQMQQQLAKMPPEQRAQMEAMMKGRGMPGFGAAAPAAKTQYKKTGTDRVGKWTCDKYEGYDNGEKTSEICTVDPKALGFSMSDFAVSKQMAEFFNVEAFKRMMPNMKQMFSFGSLEDQGYSGVPIRRTYTILGHQTTTELSEVSRQTFPDSVFAVPAGFQKQDLPGFNAGGRRGR